MINESVLLLYVLNFLFIGLLPIVFFRRGGRLSALWWLTALPLFVCPMVLIAGQVAGREVAWLRPWFPEARRILDLLAVPCAALSITLLAFTLGTHRIPISLWHQQNDAPVHIVTWGAYRRIRHPFYASFLLALLGALVFYPHPLTATTFLVAMIILNATAAREERRLRQSEFGAEYARYMEQTDRFLPRPGKGAA